MNPPTFEQEQGQPHPPKRGGLGCVWGCLIVLTITVLLIGAAVFFTARSLYRAIEAEPQIAAIVEQIRRSPQGLAMIGEDSVVMQFDKTVEPLPGRKGNATTYSIVLIGEAGMSEIHVRLETGGRDTVIASLTVTDADGRTVRLTPAQENAIRLRMPRPD